MRLLVTGGGGMLGLAVAAAAAERGHDVTSLTHGELDVSDARAVRSACADAAPEAIVNCAAWTDVDGAEEHEDEATAVNGAGAGNLARTAAELGARMIHVSTDYVFAGDSSRPYVESDEVGPLSAYGRSKLAGEREVAAAGANHAIVRTAWLFGAGGANFVDAMLALASERPELRVIADQIGCPTWTGHLAPALLDLAIGGDTGVFHVAAGGQCSRFDLARAAIERSGLDTVVLPATTDEFPRPARRPAFSALVSERVEAPRLAPWQEGLDAFLAVRGTRAGATT